MRAFFFPYGVAKLAVHKSTQEHRPCPSTSPPNKTTSTKSPNSKSGWLLPEYVNACYSVAKVVCCCPRQVMDAQSACAIKPPALPTPNNR